jgi:hypothetical protein
VNDVILIFYKPAFEIPVSASRPQSFCDGVINRNESVPWYHDSSGSRRDKGCEDDEGCGGGCGGGGGGGGGGDQEGHTIKAKEEMVRKYRAVCT